MWRSRYVGEDVDVYAETCYEHVSQLQEYTYGDSGTYNAEAVRLKRATRLKDLLGNMVLPNDPMKPKKIKTIAKE